MQVQEQLNPAATIDFSAVVERILSTVERRGEPVVMTAGELQALSELSATQSSMQQGGKLTDDLGFADVDAELVGQLVGMLEKHVVAASSIDIIQKSYNAAKKIREKQQTSHGSDNNQGLTLEQWIQYQGKASIQSIKEGLEAASILLFIITSPGMNRSVVSEDAIEASIVLFRNNLSKNILPATNQIGHIVAATSKTTTTTITPSKKRRRSNGNSNTAASELGLDKDMKKIYPSILTTLVPTILVMERLDALIQKIPLDDQELLMIASGAFISLELDPSNAVLQLVHQLHVATIGMITSIFRLYPRLRQIILEDLFPLMPKMPTAKRTMRTYPIRVSSVLYPAGLLALSQSMVPSNTDPQNVQTISVLIMSLVQSAVTRPTEEIDQTGGGGQSLQSGLRHCQAISDLFVQHLLQRCAKKGEDGGASEFRPLLSNLMDDLLLVVLVPEYPAAEMVLLSIANQISRDLMKATRNSSKVSTSETSYLNTIFDAFGKICAAEARILKFARDRPVQRNQIGRTANQKYVQCYCSDVLFSDKLMLNCDRCHTWYHGDCVGLKRESVPEEWYCDACQLQRIVELERDRNTNLGPMGCTVDLIDDTYCMQRLLIDYLSIVSRKTGEKGLQDAYGFQLARWIVELDAMSAPKAQSRASPAQINPTQIPNMSSLIVRLMELWNPSESSHMNVGLSMGNKSLSGMLHCLSDEGRSRMVVHLISKQSVLLMSFRRQIDLIVKFMANDGSALVRKLSLKAIERATDADQRLMTYPFMKKAVTRRYSDEAISVREAAVSLVGSYVVSSPSAADSFHAAFMVGLNDSGVSVRKRTIKILEDILCSNPDYKGRAAACGEMLRLAADPKEDDGVRDLIHAVFMKVWLDKGDQTIPQRSESSPLPTTPKTPSSGYVQGLEERPLTTGGKSAISMTTAATPVSFAGEMLLSPPMTRETRSSERRSNKEKSKIRSEIAAEQMVEVVKAANTGEHLTALFQELLYSARDAGTSRKNSQRKKQKLVAQDHCSMLVVALFEILLRFEENRAGVKAPGKGLVAIVRCIKVFTDVSVESVVKHLDTLLPYMKADNGLPLQEEEVIVSSMSDIISRLAGVFDQQDVERLGNSSLADDLVNVTYKLGRNAHSSAAQALCVLAHHRFSGPQISFRRKLLKVASVFYKVLHKHQGVVDFSTQKARVKANVQRSMSVLGSICQNHEVALQDDDLDEDSDEAVMKPITWENLTSQCKEIFMTYLAKDDNQTQCVALRAMCGVFIAHPRVLLYMNQTGMISKVMSTESPPSLQLEALQCWREILLAEEARIDSGEAKAKMDSKKSITLSNRISGDQDGDATLFGGVLTSHAPRLFEMTQVRDKTLRFAALDLIGHLLRQGQVNPNETIPFLLALQGDVEEDGIRALALKLLMIEGEKRPDMLRQRVCAGVKQAYAFQTAVYPDMEEVSALVRVKKHGNIHVECVFGQVFKECIRSIKKQRHGLFRNLLSLFDLQSRNDSFETATPTKIHKKSKTANKSGSTFLEDLPMLSFTCQVLAYLPYSAASDPLYIIHSMSSSLALRGPDLLDRLATFLRPYGMSSSDEMDDNNIEEDALEIAAKRNKPQDAKEATRVLESDFDVAQFSELCAEAGALTLLLRLKTFLRKAYNLSEARCIAYNPDEKEKIIDRAISKAAAMNFNANLPMIVQLGSEMDGMIFQYSEFRKLMRAETSMETKFDEEDDSEGEDESNKRKQSSFGDAL